MNSVPMFGRCVKASHFREFYVVVICALLSFCGSFCGLPLSLSGVRFCSIWPCPFNARLKLQADFVSVKSDLSEYAVRNLKTPVYTYEHAVLRGVDVIKVEARSEV